MKSTMTIKSEGGEDKYDMYCVDRVFQPEFMQQERNRGWFYSSGYVFGSYMSKSL